MLVEAAYKFSNIGFFNRSWELCLIFYFPSTLYQKGAKRPVSFYGLLPKVQLLSFVVQKKQLVDTCFR
jgi:hypothetical protein